MYYIAHVSDIMSKNVMTVGADTPFLDVAKIFDSYKFNGIPVVDGDKKLIGIITQFDVVSKMSAMLTADAKAAPAALEKLKASDVMNSEAITLPESGTIEEALKAFSEHHRVSSIPVIDADHRVLGLVSRFDILRSFNDFQSSATAS